MRVPQENPDVLEQDGTRSGNEEHCSPSGRAQEASETHQCRVIGTGACVPNLNRYLVYFVHRHLEYRLAEVEAQAAATGIADLPGGTAPEEDRDASGDLTAESALLFAWSCTRLHAACSLKPR